LLTASSQETRLGVVKGGEHGFPISGDRFITNGFLSAGRLSWRNEMRKRRGNRRADAKA
jgi:hypothetical protein